MRTSDTAARWGGEEFVITLPCTDNQGAAIFSERLRASIEKLTVLDADGNAVPITASIGYACHQSAESVDSLVDRADRAMYVAKSSGRNRVAAAPHEEPVVPTYSTSPESRVRTAL
jgi:diguanylate cyclase (GGDEF)-like protein